MSKIRVAVSGVGNCASSLLQGIAYYKNKKPGLMNFDLGGYKPSDIEVVAAFDIDKRKVGKKLDEAIFAPPNNTSIFCRDFKSDVIVQKGPVLDGVAEHMESYPEGERFVVSNGKECDVVNVLKESGAEILINYMPVGSQKATEFYADAALKAGCGFINCMPVFIASDKKWIKKFEDKGLPLIGDDIKAQIGATIVHRVLTDLFVKRGVELKRTYQLNIGGNTDFLNMLERSRLDSKKISKTEAVQSQLNKRLDDKNIHIGPSDYVAWQKDNKICFLRMEGEKFGGVPVKIDLKLSVEDSPNSAGIAVDAIRCMKLALDRGHKGVLIAPSAYFMKHPYKQMTDQEAHKELQNFING